jgi:hypothetical protein
MTSVTVKESDDTPTRTIQIDIKNTSKESRPCVAKSIQEHPNVEVAIKPHLADIVWVDRALPIKRFYLQRLASNKRVYQRTNRFYGMGDRLTKCALTKSLDILNEYQKSHQVKHKQQTSKTKDKNILTNFLPKSYRLPYEKEIVQSNITKNKTEEKCSENDWYIVKPDRGRCGRGMFLAPSLKAAVEGWENEATMDYGDPKFLKPVSKAYVRKSISLKIVMIQTNIYIDAIIRKLYRCQRMAKMK